ncbi:hypothetical protein ABC195_04495 [Microbacterium sp. 2P01SA-2]|uniref:hypothetical protein n=1 Tax=unclassified Microbacterium TaxID=2609290 RepID=UPI0039A07BEF
MTDVSVQFDTLRSSVTTIGAAERTHSRGSGERIGPARGMPMAPALTLSGFMTTGCAEVERPTIEQAKAETEAGLQQIADEVPGGVVKVVTPDPTYLACGDDTYYATLRWSVAPRPGFDGEAFLDALPGRLGRGFVVAETVDITSPAVALDHVSGALFDVKVLEVDGGVVVDLLGLTPCGVGQPPAT